MDGKECQETLPYLRKSQQPRLAIRRPWGQVPSLPSGIEPQLPFFVKCGRDTDDLRDASELTPCRQPGAPRSETILPAQLEFSHPGGGPRGTFFKAALVLLLKGPVSPASLQKGPQWWFLGSQPTPPDTITALITSLASEAGFPSTGPIQPFCPGAMKQAAAFFHQMAQREMTFTENLDKLF